MQEWETTQIVQMCAVHCGDANLFLTIRLGPKTSVYEKNVTAVSTVTGCAVTNCATTLQKFDKHELSCKTRTSHCLSILITTSCPTMCLQFSQILWQKLRTLCTCCLFHIRDIGTCWQRLTVPFHALFHPISCPQTSILLSAAVWVLNNPSCWTVFTLALCMNPSSNIAPALANSSAFSIAIGDKLLMKVTSLSQISVRSASRCAIPAICLSTSTDADLLNLHPQVRATGFWKDAFLWRSSVNANWNTDRFDITRLEKKKKQEQNSLRLKRKDKLMKFGWNNTRAQWMRLAQSKIPTTFSLVKQLPWTSSWMEQHPPLQSFEQRWCRLTTRHGRTRPCTCQRHVSWSLLLSLAHCTMKKPTTFLRWQGKIVTSARPPIQHPQSPAQRRSPNSSKQCTTDQPHASLFPAMLGREPSVVPWPSHPSAKELPRFCFSASHLFMMKTAPVPLSLISKMGYNTSLTLPFLLRVPRIVLSLPESLWELKSDSYPSWSIVGPVPCWTFSCRDMIGIYFRSTHQYRSVFCTHPPSRNNILESLPGAGSKHFFQLCILVLRFYMPSQQSVPLWRLDAWIAGLAHDNSCNSSHLSPRLDLWKICIMHDSLLICVPKVASSSSTPRPLSRHF